MRIDKEKLIEITGRKMPSHQAAWFRDYLGTEIPCDRHGPIVTEAIYEALVARACGLRRELPVGSEAIAPRPRPTVQLREPRR